MAVLLLLPVGSGMLAVLESRSNGGHVSVPTQLAETCPLRLPAAGVRGQLTMDGGPLPASAAAGVRLTYTYGLAYQIEENTSGTLIPFAAGCRAAEGNVTTTSNGSFAFVPASPPAGCKAVNGVSLCTVYSGTYGPVSVVPAGGVPAGYALSETGSPTGIDLLLVYQLASVTITPGGPTLTTSPEAPTVLTASAWAANGSASELDPTYVWTVNGTGWSVDGPTTGPSVDLMAIDGASVADVSVFANASAGGTALARVSATIDAVAVATAIDAGETNRTVLDAGGTVAVELTAVGAAGFPYSALIEPGLGLAAVGASCSGGPVVAGEVTLACSANITYPSAGTAQPTASVTNGFSSANWQFPNVVVDPPPTLEVTPAEPVGYALVPLPISVTAANGSGTAPYARACVSVPASPVACDATPGPSWSFSPTFASPGNVTLTAWAIDADGRNASTSVLVEVVPPLSVGPVSAPGGGATVGAPVLLQANVTGGLAPLRYWWNVSGLSGPLLDGEVPADGTLTATLVPAIAGTVSVTLTVLDRLGTVVASVLLVAVGPPTAQRISVVTTSPAGPVTVGEAVPLAWGAFDASGALDTSFSTALELAVRTGGAAAVTWVNASGVGPLAPVGAGVFGVPAAAWVGGTLNVNLTLDTAADVSVVLNGTPLVAGTSPVDLSVQPDRAHVRLVDPTVALAGTRTNATLWRVEDRFGNPVPGAVLAINVAFGGARDVVLATAISLPGGTSGLWVNYSAPTASSGEITVLDAAGEVVLGPLLVPATPRSAAPDPAVAALAAVVPLGAAGAAAFAVMRRRRRGRTVPPVEEELRRLAEGRARTVELIGQAGAIDLAGLEEAWGRPAPPALADWLASLVADGTVRATLDGDGRARFCLAQGPADGPHVTFDPEVLDRSLRRREAELAGPERADDEGRT